jgi:peptide/histidine transporter 3/4
MADTLEEETPFGCAYDRVESPVRTPPTIQWDSTLDTVMANDSVTESQEGIIDKSTDTSTRKVPLKKPDTLLFTCTCWKEFSERKLNIRTFLLVLCALSSTMTFCLGNNISISITTLLEGPTCYHPIAGSSPYASIVIPVLQNAIITILYPVTGWLADTIIGRGKAVRLGLWCCWIGSVLYVISFCMQYGLCGLPVNIAKYGISVLALIFVMFGTASSFSNIAPYGQDQLVNKSSAQIRSFIYWVTWGLYLGFSLSYVSFIPKVIHEPVIILTTGMIVFLFNSIVLVLFGALDYKFKPSGVLRKNPYKSIYQVLRYALRHSSPANRSALTYWEAVAPNRINLGKKKYGGPFKEDEVEDVKVFWRIFGIIASTFGLHFPLFPVLLGIFGYMNTFHGADVLDGYGSYIFWTILDQTILLIVPLIQFIVIPLFPKIEYFLVKSLKNLGALYGLMLVAILSLIVITIVGYYITPYPVPCLNFAPILHLSYYWFAIPLLFSGLVGSLRIIFTLEFIVSQSPANMSGMLIGAFWFLQATYISLGSFVSLPFLLTNTSGPGRLSCNFWIFVIHLLVFGVGFVVYFLSAWKYKRRKREEVYNYRNVIEDTYFRMLNREQAAVNAVDEDVQKTFEIFDYSSAEHSL